MTKLNKDTIKVSKILENRIIIWPIEVLRL